MKTRVAFTVIKSVEGFIAPNYLLNANYLTVEERFKIIGDNRLAFWLGLNKQLTTLF